MLLYEAINLLRYSFDTIRINLLEGGDQVDDEKKHSSINAGLNMIEDYYEKIKYDYDNEFINLNNFRVDSIIYDGSREAIVIYVRKFYDE